MKRILIAPLNWGLGHAARCIPVISALESLGAQVLLASDGSAFQLLKAEFPHLPLFELPSYRIRYKSPNMIRNIGLQLPRILWAVRAERWATERLVRAHGIKGIISDNRYGCFSRRADSVMLTHQLHLRVPNAFLQWAANRVLRSALAKFDQVWVPDASDSPNLSGALSHGDPAHPRTCYTGILSRMQAARSEREYDVAVVLSGPEPQRSYLEHLLLEQALALPLRFIFVQGKPQQKQHYFASENVEVVSFLTARELNQVLASSDVLVCRSGYSSIMDLAALGKKALVIPTPGQTEQEYLAGQFDTQGIFGVQKQENLDLEAGLENLQHTSGLPRDQYATDAFLPHLERWLQNL